MDLFPDLYSPFSERKGCAFSQFPTNARVSAELHRVPSIFAVSKRGAQHFSKQNPIWGVHEF